MARETKKARRGREEGSIFERSDGRWAAEVSLGFNGNGKRIRKTVYGANKAEVAEKLRRLQADHDAGKLVETEQLTVGEYLARWLQNTAKNKVQPTTWERYRQLVEGHLVPILGGVKLSKLAPLHVEQCYAAMSRVTTERKAAGANTRKDAGVILSSALRHAVRIKLISHNPAADVAKARPSKREMTFLSQPQARFFRSAAETHALRPLFVTALGTGMRQGELLALQWSDIDLEKGLIEVKRSLAWVKKKPLLKEPKSAAGRRKIVLPPFVVEALHDHRQASLQAGLIAAPVFHTRNGTYLDKKNVLRAFRGVVRGANKLAGAGEGQPAAIPEAIRFHDLRHTHASHLIASGNSVKAVSRRLGHSTIEMTLRVYAHLMPDDDEKLAVGVQSLFG